MAKVKLSATLPAGDHNGLLAAYKRLVNMNGDDAPLVAVCLVSRKALHLDDDTHEHTPEVRIRRLEVLTDAEDSAAMTRLLLRQYERRTGQQMLPLDLEGEIEDALRAAVDHGIDQPDEPGEPEQGEL